MDAKICLSQHKTNWDGMLKMEKFRCKQRCEQGWRIRGFEGAQAASTSSFPKAPPESEAKCTSAPYFQRNCAFKQEKHPLGFAENLSKIFQDTDSETQIIDCESNSNTRSMKTPIIIKKHTTCDPPLHLTLQKFNQDLIWI